MLDSDKNTGPSSETSSHHLDRSPISSSSASSDEPLGNFPTSSSVDLDTSHHHLGILPTPSRSSSGHEPTTNISAQTVDEVPIAPTLQKQIRAAEALLRSSESAYLQFNIVFAKECALAAFDLLNEENDKLVHSVQVIKVRLLLKLCLIYLDEGISKKAALCWSRAHAIVETLADQHLAIELLMCRGLLLQYQQIHEEAIACLTRAKAQMDDETDSPLLGEINLYLAHALLYNPEFYDEALQVAGSAAATFQRHEHPWKKRSQDLPNIIRVLQGYGMDGRAEWHLEHLTEEGRADHYFGFGHDAKRPLSVVAVALKSYAIRPIKLHLEVSNAITREAIQSLVGVLQHDQHILTVLNLNLRGESIQDWTMQVLASALMHPNSRLEKLGLIHARIGDGGMQALIKALQHLNCKLTALDLTWCTFHSETSIQMLSSALGHPNSRLVTLSLAWQSFDDHMHKLLQVLAHSDCKLTTLNLAQSDLRIEKMQMLVEMLKHPNCKLTTLNLEGASISDESMQMLAEALKHPDCKLTTLNLSGVYISVMGMQALTDALKHPNCKLTTLNLEGVSISIESMQMLGEALKHPDCRLKSLRISSNGSRGDGMALLAEALKDVNCKLISLALLGSGNGRINIDDLRILMEALQDTNSQITTLDIARNDLGYEGAVELAKLLLAPHCKLRVLKVSGNNPGNEGVTVLANALEYNRSLIELDDPNSRFYASFDTLIRIQTYLTRNADNQRNQTSSLFSLLLPKISLFEQVPNDDVQNIQLIQHALN